MFNPNTVIDANNIWEFLGTFFHSLSNEDKEKIALYWKALILGVETQFYNLKQENIAQFFELSEGWQEGEGQLIEVIFKDKLGEGRENTKKEFLKAPSNLSALYSTTSQDSDKKAYSYKVTALNSEGETLASKDLTIIVDGSKVFSTESITLSWDEVSGATSYKIWGRTPGNYHFLTQTSNLSWEDDGSVTPSGQPPVKNTAVKGYVFTLNDSSFLSISKLFFEDNTLTEGTHYDLVETDKIRFNVPLTAQTTESLIKGSYVLGESIKAVPSLEHVYLPAYGETLANVISQGYYKPHIKEWDAGTSIETHKNKARHLKNLLWGYSVFTRKSPTITNLKTTMGLVYDYPFSYEKGTVTDITGTEVTISGSNVYTYELGGGASPAVEISDQVNRFDILASGINIKDYYSDPVTISGLNEALDDPIDPAFVINLESTQSYSPSPKMIKKFKKISIPAGLLVV